MLTALYLFIGLFEFMLVQAPLAATSFIFMGWGSFGSVIEPLAALAPAAEASSSERAAEASTSSRSKAEQQGS